MTGILDWMRAKGPQKKVKLEAEVPKELVFDDEPLEAILYGSDTGKPSPADAFGPAKEKLESILEAEKVGDTEKTLRLTCDLVLGERFLSSSMCHILARLLTRFLREPSLNRTLEAGRCDLAGVLQRLWQIARACPDDRLTAAVGVPLYELYWHTERQVDARRVLATLVKIHRRKGDRETEAIFVNNYAFSYWLEGDWENAARHFHRASGIMKEMGNRVESANAWANYWASRFEAHGFQEHGQMKQELERCAEVLRKAGDWRERKSVAYLAKIEEAGGNIEAAIQLVRRAIHIGETLHPEYLDQDREHMRQLQGG